MLPYFFSAFMLIMHFWRLGPNILHTAILRQFIRVSKLWNDFFQCSRSEVVKKISRTTKNVTFVKVLVIFLKSDILGNFRQATLTLALLQCIQLKNSVHYMKPTLCESFSGFSFNHVTFASLWGDEKRNLLQKGHFALWKGHF